MWPWGHLAVGYLCYAASIELRGDGEQTPLALLAVAFGSQFPDLVDKPLAWGVAVLPSGRSFAHSLLTAAFVLGAAYRLGRRLDRTEAVAAFGVGYVSHSLVDLGPSVVFGLLRGDSTQLQWTTYLLWPALPSPPYPNDSSFLAHFAAFAFEPYVLVQFGLLGFAALVWLYSGQPGSEVLGRGVRRRLRRRA
jgi:membrane-bound metal-dependent hydrolase YbcI (DUF457 family)